MTLRGAKFALLALAIAPPVALCDEKSPYRSRYVSPPAPVILIRNATVLDGAGARLDGADLMLRDGHIAAVGRDLDAADADSVIDAAGRWVTPGLIDVHSHNGSFALPLTEQGLADISELSGPNVADTWIEHAVDVQDPSFRYALEGGVTTLQVLPGSAPVFGGRSVVLKPVPANTVYEMKFPDAPQGLKMACGENPKTEFGGRNAAPTSRQGEVSLVRQALAKARKALSRQRGERESDDSNEAEGDSQSGQDAATETLVGVLEGEIRVHLHCYRADDIAVMLAVAREFDFRIAAIHHAADAYKVPQLLREAGTCAAVWSDWRGFKMEIRDAIRENAAYVDAAGACTLLHSDSPYVGQRLNIEAAKAMAAGRQAGLAISEQRAIRWITGNSADALGLGDRIGRIAEGYNADVVIWSSNPFSIYAKVEQVFIDGVSRFSRRACNAARFTDVEIGRDTVGSCQ